MSVETAPVPAPESLQAGGRSWGSRSAWLLAVCCVAQFMVILDLSIVNVALPSIQLSLGFSSSELQWVIDAYTITFAGFLLLGGRIADRYGHRNMFVAALLLFALASLAGGGAPTRGVLIAARGAQGFAGALMAASSLAIITSSFEPGPVLHRAIGAWAAMNGLGGAAGVLFGGIITQALTWRWILLMNPPIGAAAAVVAWIVVRDRKRDTNVARFDLAGALTLTIGQMVLVYGVVEAGLQGWSAFGALGPIILGLALLAAFVVIETRFAAAPLVPFKDLSKTLQMANNIVLLFSAALFPMWFVSSLYLQQVLGLSPLDTGLIFLPMTLTIMLVARRSGKLVSHFGVRPVLGSGLVMLTTGLLLLARIGSSGSGVIYVMIPGVLVAAGIAMSIVPSTIAATQGAKQGQAGLASGIVNTSRQVGGGLGLAVLITLATQQSSHLIGTGEQVSQALTAGFRLAYLIAAALAGLAALLTFFALPRLAGQSSSRRFVAAIGAIVLVFAVLDVTLGNSKAAPLGSYKTSNTYQFVSAPSLRPPRVRTDQPTISGKLAPGYLLTANFYDLNNPPLTGQSGPLILDNSLQPVWFRPIPTSVVSSNLSLQSYEGKPALAWWQGQITNTGATESGEYVVVDQHYRTLARLHGVNGWRLTLHEFTISGNDAWVTANKNLPMNLSSYGGAYNGALIDSAVQEYNLKTGRLVRTWDALDHIPLSQSYASLPTNGFPWDAYHINSIQLIGGKYFLVSMRDDWAAYLVNIATGKVAWTLGGRNSTFRFGFGADFQWQHDVRLESGASPLHGNAVLTMFDDHCCQLTGGGTYVAASAPSRALVLDVNLDRHTAKLAEQYGSAFGLNSDYMGNTQQLANGNVLVGWGSSPYITEFSSAGTPLLDAVLPGSDLSYRASLEPWVGTPYYPPAGAARLHGGKTTVYASWNGATQVASWRVLAGSAGGSLTALATARKRGFETPIAVPGADRTFELQAIGADGRVLASSKRFSATH